MPKYGRKQPKGYSEMEPHLRPTEAIQYLIDKFGFRYSDKYFAKLRSTSSFGPRWIRHGGRIYYLPSDLDEWIMSRTRAYRTTSERRAQLDAERAQLAKTRPVARPKPEPARGRDLDVFELLAGRPG